MFNEFELNESMLDEEETETPKKKASEWLTDEELEAEPESVPETDDDEEEDDDEAEEEPPM
jgi:hypothetical protein